MARADCTEWELTINDLATNIASRGEGLSLDAITKEIGRLTSADISRTVVRDSIINANERGPRNLTKGAENIRAIRNEARQDKELDKQIKEHDEAVAKGAEPVSRTKSKAIASDIIRKKRAILRNRRKALAKAKSDEKRIAKLKDRISKKRDHLNKGTLPQPKPKGVKRTQTAKEQSLRQQEKELDQLIRQSDPAKIARIEKQIATLEEVIAEGDFAPKVKLKATRESLEVERVAFKRDELQRELRRNIDAFKPKTVWNRVADKLNISRALVTALDFSATLRQGGIMVFSNPQIAAKALVPMFRATVSKRASIRLREAIFERKNAPLYRLAKLHISDPDGALTQKEEDYQTTWARFIPGIAASERAYVTFLNQLRADSFDAFTSTLTHDGEVSLEDATTIASFVNVATGRGNLPGSFEKAAVGFNAVFFSPRFVASRFQFVLGAVSSRAAFNAKSPEVQALIRDQYVKYLIGVSSFYLLTTLFFGGDDDKDFDIEFNPTSSDFGKLRFGNTRIDPLSSLSQTVVFLSRFFGNQTKSAVTGNFRPLTDTGSPVFKDIEDVTVSFLENKFSPLMSAAVKIRTGKVPFSGEPATPKNIAAGLLIPISMEQMYEAIQEHGLSKGTALGMLDMFGMSVNIWGQAFELKPDQDLRSDLVKHTYKESGIVSRDNVDIWVNAGDPHKGQEGRVEAIKKELAFRQKTGKTILPPKKKGAK